MSSLSLAVRDSSTMLRRNLLHARRYPSLTLNLLLTPIMLLLLFVYIFVDPLSYQYLEGTEIDYVEGLHGAGFKFQNPNVKSTCGCGSSFSA